MQLRRLAVAVLAAAVPLLALGTPAGAATYPPNVPTTQHAVAPGVVFGGSTAGAVVIDACHGSTTARIASGAPFSIKVCGWIPGTGVAVSVQPPSGSTRTIDTVPADGDGDVTVGPLRLNAAGSYRFTFRGQRGSVQGLGVGGVGTRGLSRIAAAPKSTLAVTMTVPAVGTLPQTGSDSGGPSTVIWGGGLLLLGALLLLVVRARRRRAPATAAAAAAPELSTP